MKPEEAPINPLAIDAATKVLTKIKTYCPRTVDANAGTVQAWAEHLDFNNMTDLGYLLQGVTEVFSSLSAREPDFVPTPAMVTAAARGLRSDHRSRNPHDSAETLAYEALCDSKAEPDEPDYPREWTTEQRLGAYWGRIDRVHDRNRVMR